MADVDAETDAAKRRKAEKEAAKAEKLKKLQEKKAKQAAQAAPNPAKAEKKKQTQAVQWKDPTPVGEKKILGSLDDPAHSAYTSSVVESSWYAWWEKQGFFQPEFPDGKPKKRGTFVIPIPPPNVTGALHCGHAMAVALQDLMVRWERMRGFTTLYLPGCDHASISTQSVVENMLWRREQKTRHDLGRTKFLERALDWKNEYAAKINNALRRLGGSLDWTREAYTMDPNLTAAVMEAFVRLYEEGYIYRSNRLVNWCTKLNTAISNLEVDQKELKGRTLLDVPGYDKKVEFGVITHFKYPIEGTEEFIEVATTRPETMLGDTGIAVHPNDERYKHLVGKMAKHPFVQDRKMPIVADDYVDPEFGTGAVKITPAHDPNDYALGGRHNLEFINILNDDGTLNKNAGKYEGQKRFDVRYTVVQDLEQLGLFVKKEPNPMKVPLCNKSKDVIEPLMKPQWWMRMREVADEAIKVVRDGEIKIRPETSEKNYFRWLENINDWCLSRQLWWGHQVPAWKVVIAGKASEGEEWIVARTEAEAEEKAATKYKGQQYQLIQDPDVLDTWFSSGLWPFATLGWPKETNDMKYLFPTNVLETGWDILFFWVARMIMLSLKLTGKIPFKEVYCHSLIRDSEGRKMSKSLGNVVDPLDVMDGISLEDLNQKLLSGNLDPKELATATKYQKTAFPQGMPECGTDALRFTLIQYTTGGGDIALDIKVIAANRRFCNKIYQATKYVLGKLPEGFVPRKDSALTGNETLAEKWILHNLAVAAREVNKALAAREFSRSTQIVYSYWYEQLCDVFIENSKTIIQDGTDSEKESAVNTLYTALEGALAMLHPFMPFLSEELWQRLPRRPGDETPSIIRAAFPEDLPYENPTAAAEYGLVLRGSKGVRSLMAEYNFKENGNAFIHASTEDAHKIITKELASIKSLSGKNVSNITILGPTDSAPSGCAVFAAGAGIIVYLEVRGRVAVADLLSNAQAKHAKAEESVKKQRALIETDDWKEKASEAVRQAEQDKLQAAEEEERSFAASIKQFENMKLEDA